MSRQTYSMNYTSSCPTILGVGVAAQVGEKMAEMGSKKVFLVCDKGVVSTGMVSLIEGYIKKEGLEVVIFDGVLPDPPDTMIDEAARLMKAAKCDGLVGIGGGSTLDTTKSLRILSANDGPIMDYCVDTFGAKKEGVPTILLPTTSGTGAEVSFACVITITSLGLKCCVANILPSLALIDPNLCKGMPPFVTASTGMDALAHAIELILSPNNNLNVEILCEKAIRYIFRSLKKAVDDGSDIEARTDMCCAAYIGGLGICDAFMPFGHAIAHTVGAKFHLAHGAICAVVTPMTVKFLGPHYPEKMKVIADAMGIQFKPDIDIGELVRLVADKVTALRRSIGLKNIKELGITQADFDVLAEESLNDIQMNFGEYSPTKEDIYKYFVEEFNA